MSSVISKCEEDCAEKGSLFTLDTTNETSLDILEPTTEVAVSSIQASSTNEIKPVNSKLPKHVFAKDKSDKCYFDTNCTRRDCFYKHPNGRLIDQIHNTNIPEKEPSKDQLIELIENLLSKANEKLNSREVEKSKAADDGDGEDDNDDDNDQSDDDEPILDIVKQDEVKELELQQSEFRSVVARLNDQFYSIDTSEEQDNYQELRHVYRNLERELKRMEKHLPIYSKRTEIIELVKKNQILILKADTGSGKSTQVVQYLCDAEFANEKQILCTQPRKLAACSLAARVAEEYGCILGQEVGFYVGGRRPESTSDQTKIKFVTDTLLLKEYQKDPLLQSYSVVIIDEAHERKIDTDLALGIMKQCLKRRKDLKFIVMSATLDIALLHNYFTKDFLNSCDKLEIAGRAYPIEDTYLDDDVKNYVQASVEKVAEIYQGKKDGDILVFLTGQDEIDLAINELKQKLRGDNRYEALPLHQKLSEDESAQIFKKIPHKRKIIFSTNVAETSITIDGIRHVIETGMIKEKMWDDKRKMQVLKIGQATKSSVKQRRGRAGRTSPGKCYHLYTTATYESMDLCPSAEVLCTQPTLAILKLKSLGFDDINSFEWIEPPSSSNIQEAQNTLIWLNVLDDRGELTDLGKDMAHLGIDPRLTAMLHKAKELQCVSQVLIIAGMLTVSQNIWWRGKGEAAKQVAIEAREKLSHECGDHITLLIIYWKWRDFGEDARKDQYDWCKNNYINAKSLNIADVFIEEISKQMDHEMTTDHDLNQDLIARILQCLTAGFFQNLAVSNGPFEAGYRVVPAFPPTSTNTLIARISLVSALPLKSQKAQYVLYNELVNLNGIDYITTLSTIDPDWLRTVSQQWYISAGIGDLHLITFESILCTDIPAALMRAVVGKCNCKLNVINEAIQGTLQTDYKNKKLTIWCQKSNSDNAKKIIEEMLKKEEQKLSDEQEEIQIVGRTRIVMGNGGECKMVLVENEFIRIILTMLPAKITEGRINELCEPYGHVRDISFLQQTSNGTSVAVTYRTPDEAHIAWRNLNYRDEQGRQISVGSAHLNFDALIGKQNFSLKAIWYLTPSLGSGKLIFTNENSALAAYRFFKTLYYECRYERPDDLPKVELTYYRGQITRAEVKFKTIADAKAAVKQMHHTTLESKKINCKREQDVKNTPLVKVTGLPADVDEEDVRNHFRSCAGVLDVIVVRQRNTMKFDTEDAKNKITKLFENYQTFHNDSITIKNFPQEKTVANATFSDENELRRAIDEMNGKTGFIGCGKVRISAYVNKRKKKHEDEYVIHLQNLDTSSDKYDIIKILKEQQLYNYIKKIIIRRQKLRNQTRTTTVIETDDIGRAVLQKKFEENQYFSSTPTFRICSPTSDGIVVAHVFFDYPVDVETAINRYNNSQIQLPIGTSNLRLIPLMAHEILVHPALAKAIPDQIQQAIKSVKEELHNQIDMKLHQSTTDNATMKITIDGDDMKQIREAKTKFESIIKGTEYILKDNPEKVRIIFSRAGKNALQRIQEETGSYIWWNVPNLFIRIYGPVSVCTLVKENIDKYIQSRLTNEICTIKLPIPSGCLDYTRNLISSDKEFEEINHEVAITFSYKWNHRVDLTGAKENVIECKRMIQQRWNTFSNPPLQMNDQSSSASRKECVICLNESDYDLQACGHSYCNKCLKDYLSQYFSGVQIKIKCAAKQCDFLFLLRDIKTILGPNDMRKLANASFQSYVKIDEDLVHCPGDKEQVFRKSKNPVYFACDYCLKTYCVKCEEEYHYGWTCEQNKAFVTDIGKQQFKTNIGSMNVKFCPNTKCRQPCWKEEDCNAVRCGCGIYFCWLCLYKDTSDIHYHFKDENSKCYMKLGFKE